ncbi:MAG: type II secretion system F family protein [Angustibacter sp.]
MIAVMLSGAVVGLGALVAVQLLVPRPVSPAVDLARLDAERRRVVRTSSLVADRRHESESLRLRRLGDPVVRALLARGVQLVTLRTDLAVVGRSVEMHLARSLLGAAVGLVLAAVQGALLVVAAGPSLAPFGVVLPVLGGLVGLLLPTVEVRRQATARRRDFRHVLGSFLDLVAMNLAGGRGVPEALTSASSVSSGWAMVRLRDALENARLQGVTAWAALGQLGEELDVDELRDLAAALGLVAEDGAKVRDSLTARAASMRTRELAEMESHAQENSQSMLVAQLLLCLGFLIFLTYPAVANVLGG